MCVVHEIIWPKNKPRFSQTTMEQYWLGFSIDPKCFQKVATEFLRDGYNNTGHNKIIHMLFWCAHNIMVILIIVINTSWGYYRFFIAFISHIQVAFGLYSVADMDAERQIYTNIRTHAHARTHMHAHTHAHKHTHTRAEQYCHFSITIDTYAILNTSRYL